MSRRNNVNPDHYKVDGRLRPDDAASARLSRAIAAKTTSQQRPDRMGKTPYFERPEPSAAPAGTARDRPAKKRSGRGAPKKSARPAARAAASRGTKRGTRAARPSKKR